MDQRITIEDAGSAQRIPWVSFCMATYRRPERLRDALTAIREQTFSDFEVIVSDNDPTQSSRDVAESFGDARIRYFANAQNVGMVKNFNVALSYARGQFVVMITDDDPPYPCMLEKLHRLVQQYPGYGAYYGACEVLLENVVVAEMLGAKVGKQSFTIDAAPDSVRTYDSTAFLRTFFSRRIFRYMLWSAGVVEREIAVRNGGMPDYGAPFLTDFAYMSLAGAAKGFVALNTALGYQAVHGQNAGFDKPHALREALDGCHDYISQRLAKRSDWPTLRPQMENFLGTYVVGHIAQMAQHGARGDGFPSARERFESLASIPYIGRLRTRYLALRILYSVPAAQWLYGIVKKLQSRRKKP